MIEIIKEQEVKQADWLQGLNVGDDVVIVCRYVPNEYKKVTRLTQTLIIVDNMRFSRTTGWLKADGYNSKPSLKRPTHKLVEDILKRYATRDIMDILNKNPNLEALHEALRILQASIAVPDGD